MRLPSHKSRICHVAQQPSIAIGIGLDWNGMNWRGWVLGTQVEPVRVEWKVGGALLILPLSLATAALVLMDLKSNPR